MTGFQIGLNKMISLFFAVILIPFSVLTHGIDLISAEERTDSKKTNVVGIGAFFRSQGIATDGESFYFSSKKTLIQTKLDGTTVINTNYSAIPDELSDKYGIAHIGGLSFYNGFIYAGLEDSKVWNYPMVGVYDAETLELVNYFIMDDEVITRGMPWVCVDPQTGYLYCMDHSKKPEKILVYDANNNMNFVKETALSQTVPSIQGAEFYDGVLYAATNDETQSIYKIDVETGTAEKFIDRNLTDGSEGEGMTIIVKDGKPTIVAIDMGPLFINAFIREYDF